MQDQKTWNKYLYSIILIGIIFRVVVYWVSPPNNSYDNHLEPIALYSESFSRTAPFECWECYQPPAYYYMGAAVLKTSQVLGIDKVTQWKFVQLINLIFSILVLIICFLILSEFNISGLHKTLYMSFLVCLPRDILTASMIGNDYLLVLTTVSAYLFFIRCKNAITEAKLKELNKNYILLSVCTILGVLTKQHGLLLVIFPLSIILICLIEQKELNLKLLILGFLAIASIAVSEEVWKYSQSGNFMVSNQDFYNYAKEQPPGALSKIEFFTFRIISLFQNPFMSKETLSSFPSELFARTFFDYEWRFLSPKLPVSHYVGRLGYLLGIIWSTFFLWSMFKWTLWFLNTSPKLKINISLLIKLTPIVVGLCFISVPFLQTLRYPYFSSMKSMFLLAGIFILIMIHSKISKDIKYPPKVVLLLISMNVFYGIIFILAIAVYIYPSLNFLSGPLWEF